MSEQTTSFVGPYRVKPNPFIVENSQGRVVAEIFTREMAEAAARRLNAKEQEEGRRAQKLADLSPSKGY